MVSNEPTNTHRELPMNKQDDRDDMTREKVENYLKKKIEENPEITDHNTQLLQTYYKRQKGTKGRSRGREQWYLGKWRTISSRYLDGEKLDEMNEFDWKSVITDIAEDPEKDYADSVIDDFKGAVRDYYKQVYPSEPRRTDRVKAILDLNKLENMKESDKQRKRKENILTPQQVWKMCEVAENPRDSCLPIFLFDAGCRTEEAVERTSSDIEEHSEYWLVEFHDAKDNKPNRNLPLTQSMPKLQNWLEHHPNRDEDDFDLWVGLSSTGQGAVGQKLSGSSLNNILKKLAKKAELKEVDGETVTVTDFRKSSATFRGTEKGWGIQQMIWWYTWRKYDRARSYCRDDNKRMKKAILDRHGISAEDNEEKMKSFQMKTCPRCQKERPQNAKYCPECSLPVETETAIRDSELLRIGQKVVEDKLDEKVDDKRIRELVEEIKT